jgi:type IV pilus assembly protein PilE
MIHHIEGDTMRAMNNGFTLIEVMIVVAIVGILATVAYPSYQDYLDRGKATDAITTLSDQRVRLEQFFQDNRNYGTGGVCGKTAGGAVSLPYPVDSLKKYFTITCAPDATGATYVLTATQTSGPAFVYTVNQNNARATVTFKGVAATCTTGWQSKKGETC